MSAPPSFDNARRPAPAASDPFLAGLTDLLTGRIQRSNEVDDAVADLEAGFEHEADDLAALGSLEPPVMPGGCPPPSEGGNLWLAAQYGDVDALRKLIEVEGADPNALDAFDRSPLYCACLNGRLRAATYLLERGARCEADTFEGERAFYGALNENLRHLLRQYEAANRQRGPLYAFLYRIFNNRNAQPDVTFLVDRDDTIISAHKLILCARSPFFRARFAPGGRWHGRRYIRLTSSAITGPALRAVCSYLYTERLMCRRLDLHDVAALAGVCRLGALSRYLDLKRGELFNGHDPLATVAINLGRRYVLGSVPEEEALALAVVLATEERGGGAPTAAAAGGAGAGGGEVASAAPQPPLWQPAPAGTVAAALHHHHAFRHPRYARSGAAGVSSTGEPHGRKSHPAPAAQRFVGIGGGAATTSAPTVDISGGGGGGGAALAATVLHGALADMSIASAASAASGGGAASVTAIADMYADAARHYRVHKLTGPPSRAQREEAAAHGTAPTLLASSAAGGAAASAGAASVATAAPTGGGPTMSINSGLGNSSKQRADEALLESDPILRGNGLREHMWSLVLRAGAIPASAAADAGVTAPAAGAASGTAAAAASDCDRDDPWHYGNGMPYDLRIDVQGHVFRCHKVVLCRRSQYLSAMVDFTCEGGGSGLAAGGSALSSSGAPPSVPAAAVGDSPFDALVASFSHGSTPAGAAGAASAPDVMSTPLPDRPHGSTSGTPALASALSSDGRRRCDEDCVSLALSDVSPFVFALIVEYAYTDAVRPIPTADLTLEALYASDLFVVTDGLKPLLVTQAMRHMSIDTVVPFLRAADLLNLQRLTDACARFAVFHLDALLRPPPAGPADGSASGSDTASGDVAADFGALVMESASSIQKREEADSIPVLDSIISAAKAAYGAPGAAHAAGAAALPYDVDDTFGFASAAGGGGAAHHQFEHCMDLFRAFAVRLGLRITGITA